MRAGACAAQQTLSAEAAAVLKHSLSLARRRGHAQVTPLHVAATLLTSRASLLRRACLKSQPPQPHHHPLQCRALELCFNVALNRLPASPGPLLHAQPSLSNALVAALKRAQAHQRRGCIEQQQPPPLVAVKVELEQLILSILDDPSVSRVMREAGFSSTQVKANLDDCSASVFHCYNPSAPGGIFSAPNSPPEPRRQFINWQQQPHFRPVNDEVSCLFDIMRRRRNAVVVADTTPVAEALVSQLISLVEKGDAPEAAQVVKFQFSSVPLALMNKEEVDMNVADLKRKVDSYAAVGRVVVYIGDLKWTVEHSAAVEHLIAEIGKLLGWYNGGSAMKVWLIATATYQTYVKCQIKHPPLDAQWALQPLSLPSPAPALGLTLNAPTPMPIHSSGGSDSRIAFSENSSPVSEKKLFSLKEETDDAFTCCQECTSDYEKEAALRSIHHKSFSHKDHLPYWLKPHANKEDLDQLKRKYNKQCQNLHQNQSSNNHSYFTSQHPCWSSKSAVFADSDTISFSYPAVRPGASTLPRFRRQQSCHIEFSFSNTQQPNLDSLKRIEDKEVKITLALGRGSCIDEVKHERAALHTLLEENLPWQLQAIPYIVDALMGSQGRDHIHNFLVLHGNDNVAKRRVALSAAESILGSSDLLLVVSLRDNERSGRETLQRALRDGRGGKVVALVEDAEFADAEMVKLLSDGLEAKNGDSVFILATDCDVNSRCNDTSSVIQMKLVVGECTSPHQRVSSLDHKRRAGWESGRVKRQRSNEAEEVSSNGLDLNVRADEDEGKVGDISPISSDLTREVMMEAPRNTLNFLENRVALNRGTEEDRKAKEMVVAEFKKAFDEAGRGRSLEVEEKVLEKVLRGCGKYLNGLFGKWLKDILQTSLNGINSGEMVRVRLCLVGKENGEGERDKDGFKGTCLPKRIPLSYIG